MDFDLILRVLFDALQYGGIYLLGAEVTHRKLHWKSCLLYIVIGMVLDFIEARFFSGYGILNLVSGLCIILFQTYFVFRSRGKDLLLDSVKHLAVMYFSAILCSAVNSLLFGLEYMAKAAAESIYKPVPITGINIIVLVMLWYILRSILSLIRKEKLKTPDWLPVLRSSVMLVLSIVFAIILLKDFASYNAEDRLLRVILIFSLSFVMLITVFSTLIQDVRNLQLRKWGETLEREKQTNEALIRDLRVFRHNIINTLYGFRGVIASGSAQEQLAYYESLASDLRRLNNENVLALQQLRSPALSALLMEKLNEAGKKELPVYLYTKGSPVIRGPEERKLCAAAGALIDNAVEAALESEAGNVRIQVAQENGETSLTVMNTFPDSLDVEAFLAGKGTSTKEGHTGLGLGFVEETVRKNPKMSFFRRQHGRYIECVLICGE